MNPIVILVGFALGFTYGRMVGGARMTLLAAAGILMAVLLGNYPYYDVAGVAVTYAAALAGVAAGSRRNR